VAIPVSGTFVQSLSGDHMGIGWTVLVTSASECYITTVPTVRYRLAWLLIQ